ncbi:unnamed protein product [Effrenium voratum]|nr:unnamed protein product [Effrenium voratum]
MESACDVRGSSAVESFEQVLSDICDELDLEASGQARSVLENTLRRQCCRLLDEQLMWIRQSASERLRACGVQQERQLRAAREVLELKDQQCIATLQELSRQKVQRKQSVDSLVALLSQARLCHWTHLVFLRWASLVEARRSASQAALGATRVAAQVTEQPCKVRVVPTPLRRGGGVQTPSAACPCARPGTLMGGSCSVGRPLGGSTATLLGSQPWGSLHVAPAIRMASPSPRRTGSLSCLPGRPVHSARVLTRVASHTPCQSPMSARPITSSVARLHCVRTRSPSPLPVFAWAPVPPRSPAPPMNLWQSYQAPCLAAAKLPSAGQRQFSPPVAALRPTVRLVSRA